MDQFFIIFSLIWISVVSLEPFYNSNHFYNSALFQISSFLLKFSFFFHVNLTENFLLNSCAIPHGVLRFIFIIRVTAGVHLVAIVLISLLYLFISFHWWCGVARCEVFPAGCAVAHPCKTLPCGNLRLYQAPVTSPWRSGTFSATRLMKQGRACLRKKGDWN